MAGWYRAMPEFSTGVLLKVLFWCFIYLSRHTRAGFWGRWSWGLLRFWAAPALLPLHSRAGAAQHQKNAPSLPFLLPGAETQGLAWAGIFPSSPSPRTELQSGPLSPFQRQQNWELLPSHDAPGFPSLMSLDGSFSSCPHLKHIEWKWIPI